MKRLQTETIPQTFFSHTQVKLLDTHVSSSEQPYWIVEPILLVTLMFQLNVKLYKRNCSLELLS